MSCMRPVDLEVLRRERENKVSERDVSIARERTKRWIRRQD